MIIPVSADQAVFVDTTARFLQRTCGVEAVRALADTPAGFARDWWAQAAELGWTSMLVPEERGGGSVSGAGLLDLVHVAEQVGRHVAPGPLIALSAALTGVAGSAGAERHAAAIESVVAGDAVLTWCPEGAELDRRGGELVLTGTATEVEAAADADLLLVTAGDTQVLLPAGTAGVEVTRTGSIDLTRRLARVRFDAVRVPRDAVVGALGAAGADVERQDRAAVVLQGAEAVGAAERVFEFTLEYVAQRYSFGRPLASYQALKHRFADMKTALEAARGIVAGAALAAQADDGDAARVVAAAGAWVGDALPQLVQDCVQMHGGIGVTWEHDIHLYLRRVALTRALYGTPDHHRRALALSAAA